MGPGLLSRISQRPSACLCTLRMDCKTTPVNVCLWTDGDEPSRAERPGYLYDLDGLFHRLRSRGRHISHDGFWSKTGEKGVNVEKYVCGLVTVTDEE